MKILETERLILRTWQEKDFVPFCAMNQNPKVMEYFPSVLNESESRAIVDKVKQHFKEHGYTWYSTALKSSGEFIGMVGLIKASFDAHFTPTTEIGWRLMEKHWGKGYATEAAKAALDFAFTELKLPEVVSFTTKDNGRSRRVMEKVGLQYEPKDDFHHPKLNKESPLSLHVLYRLSEGDLKINQRSDRF